VITGMIVVETVVQVAGRGAGQVAGQGQGPAPTADPETGRVAAALPAGLVRQAHRVPGGTSIRTLLHRAGQGQAVLRIEAGTLGLACHGRRAWLDDVLENGSRVEVVEPINVDAKAARAARVATERARRRAGSGTAG
jgi:putative ubiquitin-RnfH superfamily antitoxin RatB of RatAB toxin-antitoxin module